MKWTQLISATRLGQEGKSYSDHQEARSQFQRDYDRLIFSSPFRRLQDKTQVFPLPGSVFVHNRLTHSLEVASVGRSLGNMIAQRLIEHGEIDVHSPASEMGSIISAACLAHDLGNPPFGHSGEDAISEYFISGEGTQYETMMTEREWMDLCHFEGNANAFRLLSHQFSGRRPGGYALTYSTLASIVKYPFESVHIGGKKYGFFQSEIELYQKVATHLGLIKLADDPLRYCRHPLVYLVEAADDICYQIMDVEDAHKLGILSTEETKELYLAFFDEKEDAGWLKGIMNNLDIVTDRNEQISYLRASVIGKLVNVCVDIFWSNRDKILAGTFEKSLFHYLDGTVQKAMEQVKRVSFKKIYEAPTVVQIEVAGFKILGTLLHEFTTAVMNPDRTYSKRIISMMAEQFRTTDESTYVRLRSVVDMVSGMTDLYALDLYRKIKGISVPSI